VKFDGNCPRWFFKEDVSTVWKDDRRSDKSYSHEKSGKFRKSTSISSARSPCNLPLILCACCSNLHFDFNLQSLFHHDLIT
ncbi:hypothetical protein Tco_0788444, partial [Tanacetum coccineum]